MDQIRSQMTIHPQNNNLNYLIDPNLQMLTDYLFCHLQELMHVMTETLFQIIMYQTLKLKTSMS